MQLVRDVSPVVQRSHDVFFVRKDGFIMYKQHDTVFYQNNGICEIIDICEKTISNITKTYYVLQPINNQRSIIYIPCDSEVLVSQMKKLLSKEQIEHIIKNLSSQPLMWIEDRTKRKEKFQEILHQGDCLEIATMLKSIYYKKIELTRNKKKLSSYDDTIYREAEKILVETFAYILEMDKDKIIPYILQQEN